MLTRFTSESYPIPTSSPKLISLPNISNSMWRIVNYFSIHNFFSFFSLIFFPIPPSCLSFSLIFRDWANLWLLYDVICAHVPVTYLSCRFVPQETPEKGVSSYTGLPPKKLSEHGWCGVYFDFPIFQFLIFPPFGFWVERRQISTTGALCNSSLQRPLIIWIISVQGFSLGLVSFLMPYHPYPNYHIRTF